VTSTLHDYIARRIMRGPLYDLEEKASQTLGFLGCHVRDAELDCG
jgi:hypothetical protein